MNQLDAKKSLAGMFQCFNTGGDEKDKLAKLDCYWAVLKDLPCEIIVKICERAAKGKIGNPGFLPSSAELYQDAERIQEQIAPNIRLFPLLPRSELPPLPEPDYSFQKFDPSAETFSPIRLKMDMETIRKCLSAHRNGEDWKRFLPPSQGGSYIIEKEDPMKPTRSLGAVVQALYEKGEKEESAGIAKFNIRRRKG